MLFIPVMPGTFLNFKLTLILFSHAGILGHGGDPCIQQGDATLHNWNQLFLSIYVMHFCHFYMYTYIYICMCVCVHESSAEWTSSPEWNNPRGASQYSVTTKQHCQESPQPEAPKLSCVQVFFWLIYLLIVTTVGCK